MKSIIAETIEEFMATVPGEDDREWASDDMADKIWRVLSANGCVKLSANQEMPHITEDIAKLSVELIKNGADFFTAGAGGMWEAIKEEGFKRIEPL